MINITPSPWEVESGGQPGEYFISGVAHEQSEWIDEGYDISPEEGDRRTDLAGQRDENNRRLIQAAPKLYQACKIAKEWFEKMANDERLVEKAIDTYSKWLNQ